MAAPGDGRFLEAADHIRKSPPADAEHATDAEIVRQARRIREWADQTSCLITPERFAALCRISQSTSEHAVYFDRAQNRAIKVTFPGEFGWMPTLDNGRWNLGVATPLNYLRRWQLFNEAFGDDVRLEGIIFSESPVMAVRIKIEPAVHRDFATLARSGRCKLARARGSGSFYIFGQIGI